MSNGTKYVPLLDQKQRRVEYLFTRGRTVYVIKKFQRERIPPLFKSIGDNSIGIGKLRTLRDLAITDHRNIHFGMADDPVTGARAYRPLSKVIDHALEYHTPQCRPRTQTKHRIYFDLINQAIGQVDISLVLEKGTEWIRKMKAANGRRRVFREYTKHLNLLMRHAHTVMIARGKPYASHLVVFPNPDGEHKTPWRHFTQKEIAALWSKMEDQLRDVFVLAYPNGMRLRECLDLTWDRVNLRSGKITLREIDVKTGKAREFFPSPEAVERLRRRAAENRFKGPYVFSSRYNPSLPLTSIQKSWQRAKQAAKIKGRARWHDLRHSSISDAVLVRGADITQASEFFGVSVATIQKVYLHSKAEHTKGVVGDVWIGKFENGLKNEE